MADTEKVIDLLHKLVDTCRDGENGYSDAAEHISDSELRAYFNDQSLERARFAGDLQQILVRLGENKVSSEGSLGGKIHRTWIDLKSNLGGGDKAILDAVEAGEDKAKEVYEEALRQPLPEDILATIRVQAQSVIAAHDQVKLFRDRKKAA